MEAVSGVGTDNVRAVFAGSIEYHGRAEGAMRFLQEKKSYAQIVPREERRAFKLRERQKLKGDSKDSINGIGLSAENIISDGSNVN